MLIFFAFSLQTLLIRVFITGNWIMNLVWVAVSTTFVCPPLVTLQSKTCSFIRSFKMNHAKTYFTNLFGHHRTNVSTIRYHIKKTMKKKAIKTLTLYPRPPSCTQNKYTAWYIIITHVVIFASLAPLPWPCIFRRQDPLCQCSRPRRPMLTNARILPKS